MFRYIIEYQSFTPPFIKQEDGDLLFKEVVCR